MAPRAKILDRLDHFPATHETGELSVLSWNLLAPSANAADQPDWEEVRWPALQKWLARISACDVLCFQELEPGRSLECVCAMLSAQGFEPVVQEKDHFLRCSTFYKAERLKLIWSQSRSRALLACFALADGRELAVGNMHLQAGPKYQDELQRISQLQSVMRRLSARRPWCQLLCGDYNSELVQGSALLKSLTENNLCRVHAPGPTYITKNGSAAIDHIFIGQGLRELAVLGSDAAALRAITVAGLPDAEYPSDHLPIAAVLEVEPVSRDPTTVAPMLHALSAPNASTSMDLVAQLEWIEISRLSCRPLFGRSKKESLRLLREQKDLENAFLDIVGGDTAKELLSWRAHATEAARSLVGAAVRRACTALVIS